MKNIVARSRVGCESEHAGVFGREAQPTVGAAEMCSDKTGRGASRIAANAVVNAEQPVSGAKRERDGKERTKPRYDRRANETGRTRVPRPRSRCRTSGGGGNDLRLSLVLDRAVVPGPTAPDLSSPDPLARSGIRNAGRTVARRCNALLRTVVCAARSTFRKAFYDRYGSPPVRRGNVSQPTRLLPLDPAES